MITPPDEGLKHLGVDPGAVKDVIITHLHYDHVGNFDLFPAAVFHLQDDEMSYATGRHMAHEFFSYAYEVDEVVAMVRKAYQGRVRFHDGDAELAPGLSLHKIGGHTRGLHELADAPELIVPGHDPLVMERYAAAKAGLQGIAVRLDQSPKTQTDP